MGMETTLFPFPYIIDYRGRCFTVQLQNIADFLNNPSGKGSSIIMNREQIRSFLDAKYKALIAKHGDFKVHTYHHKDSYFYHIIIPSETERKNTYDVVIQFVNGDGKTEDFSNDLFLNNYYIKLFSNCPSFTYTYAYVYNENGCMVDQLQTKFSDDVLTNAPTTRNPGEIASYEKSTYYACKFLKEHKIMLGKHYVLTHGKKGITELIKSVRNTDEIEMEIARENSRLDAIKAKKKKNKPQAKIERERDIRRTTNRGHQKITAKKNATNVIKPKAKISAKKSTVKK